MCCVLMSETKRVLRRHCEGLTEGVLMHGYIRKENNNNNKKEEKTEVFMCERERERSNGGVKVKERIWFFFSRPVPLQLALQGFWGLKQ